MLNRSISRINTDEMDGYSLIEEMVFILRFKKDKSKQLRDKIYRMNNIFINRF